MITEEKTIADMSVGMGERNDRMPTQSAYDRAPLTMKCITALQKEYNATKRSVPPQLEAERLSGRRDQQTLNNSWLRT
jgi:hypothetical protein